MSKKKDLPNKVQADAPTIHLDATASRLLVSPPPSSPIFMPNALSATTLPFILGLDSHGIKLACIFSGLSIKCDTAAIAACNVVLLVCCQKPAPAELLMLFDVPDVSSIHFHTINPSSNHASATQPANALFPLDDIPVTFQLDDIKTNFVMVRT